MATATKEIKEKKATKSQLKLQPLGDRLVVRRETSESRTAGGIVLPDAAKEKPTRGVVEAVGNGKLLDDGSRGKLQVQVGDRVLFTSWAGETFKVSDDELLLMREEDILAILED
jgi:chaperonin GroES